MTEARRPNSFSPTDPVYPKQMRDITNPTMPKIVQRLPKTSRAMPPTELKSDLPIDIFEPVGGGIATTGVEGVAGFPAPRSFAIWLAMALDG
jgi:hypothetical protein